MVTCWITRPNSCPTSKIMTLLDSHNISKTPEFSVHVSVRASACVYHSFNVTQDISGDIHQIKALTLPESQTASGCSETAGACWQWSLTSFSTWPFQSGSASQDILLHKKKRRPHHAGSCCVTSSGTEGSLCGVFLRVRVWAVSFCSCFKSALLSHISHKLVSEEVAQMKCQPWGGGFFSSA